MTLQIGSQELSGVRKAMYQAMQLAIACLLAGAPSAAAQGVPDLSGLTASQLIPFANPQVPPFSDGPELMIGVTTGPGQGVKPRRVKMDTGSTGLLIAYDRIPNYRTLKFKGTPGYQFYSSSKSLSVGTWVPATVTFYDASGSTALATASVPVLGVERSGICPQYKSGGICPGKRLASAMGRPIFYMGVGFGQEADFMPQATPDKNPLLNLNSIAGEPLSSGAFGRGYILGGTGVTVGLTSANAQGFSFIKLAPYLSESKARIDWSPATMCVQIDDSPCYPGTVLVDTGVSQSYITIPFPLPKGSTMPHRDPSNPSRTVGVLVPNTTVTMNLPGMASPIVTYSYKVTADSRGVPQRLVIPDWPLATGQEGSFVNTGRSFLREYLFLYDATNGYIGLRPQADG